MLANDGQKVLVMDRTDWQFDQTTINIFMPFITHEGTTFPLTFTMLPSSGNSNSLKRITIRGIMVKPNGAKQKTSSSTD